MRWAIVGLYGGSWRGRRDDNLEKEKEKGRGKGEKGGKGGTRTCWTVAQVRPETVAAPSSGRGGALRRICMLDRL